MIVRNHRKGRIEAIKCAGEIIHRRAAGESLVSIYADLTDRDAVTIGYSSFARWVQKIDAGELRPCSGSVVTPCDADRSQDLTKPNQQKNAQPDSDNKKQRGPRHGIVGLKRSAPINTAPNPDELF